MEPKVRVSRTTNHLNDMAHIIWVIYMAVFVPMYFTALRTSNALNEVLFPRGLRCLFVIWMSRNEPVS